MAFGVPVFDVRFGPSLPRRAEQLALPWILFARHGGLQNHQLPRAKGEPGSAAFQRDAALQSTRRHERGRHAAIPALYQQPGHHRRRLHDGEMAVTAEALTSRIPARLVWWLRPLTVVWPFAICG